MSGIQTGAGAAAKAIQQLSANGLSLLKQFEGFRQYVYSDAAGHPTIGYGHKILPGEVFTNGITEPQAQTLLLADTAKAQASVRNLVKVPLTPHQFDALVSLVYNIGHGAFLNSTLLRLLNQSFYNAAAQQFLQWKFAGGKPILLSRRVKEKTLFETPVEPGKFA